MLQQKINDPADMSVSIHPMRSILKTEELASFMGRASRQGNNIKPTLVELFDAHNNELRYYAISRGADIVVPNPYFQMVATTQPKAIHEFLSRTDTYSGFLNRWVFASGTRRVKRLSHGGKKVDLTDSIELLKTVKMWADPGICLEMEPDALKAWDDFYQAEISPLYDKDEDAMFIRIDLMLKKIMIILSCNELESYVTADVVAKTIKLYPYLLRTYAMFSDAISHDAYRECEQRILELLTQHPNMTTGRIVNRLKNKYSNKMIEQCLKTLESLELVEISASKPKNGKTTKAYSVAK